MGNGRLVRIRRVSLGNLGLEQIDLIQCHTWEDAWLDDDRWAWKLDDLPTQGLTNLVGISINRWEPWNGVRAVQSGLIDAVRCAKLALDRGNSGPVVAPSAYFMKTPPVQYTDDAAHQMVEDFIAGKEGRWERIVAEERAAKKIRPI